MMCYRDMTFCPYIDCKDADVCFRVLTEEVREKAKDWGQPICQFAEEPSCYREKEKEE